MTLVYPMKKFWSSTPNTSCPSKRMGLVSFIIHPSGLSLSVIRFVSAVGACRHSVCVGPEKIGKKNNPTPEGVRLFFRSIRLSGCHCVI
jgi:hypothetical protein